MKRSISAFGILGLVGCFLPLALGMSWFDMRQFGSLDVWLVLVAFGAAAYAGAAKSESDRVAAVVGTGAFGYLLYTFGTGVFDLVIHASLGGIMMGVAVIGGLGSSLLALGASRR